MSTRPETPTTLEEQREQILEKALRSGVVRDALSAYKAAASRMQQPRPVTTTRVRFSTGTAPLA